MNSSATASTTCCCFPAQTNHDCFVKDDIELPSPNMKFVKSKTIDSTYNTELCHYLGSKLSGSTFCHNDEIPRVIHL